VWLSYKDDGKRNHPYTWEMVEVDGVLVGINTQHPNRIVEEALNAKRIAPLASYHQVKREAVMSASRFDFLLQGEGLPPCYLEVKNVHLKRGAFVEFPDSLTSRGTKHLNELAQLAQQGYRAVMLYCVQRQDGEAFRLASDIDPAYAAAFAAARAAGVEALCYTARVTPTSITLDAPLPFAV
jgi:sugar fermentation stimulation protein A